MQGDATIGGWLRNLADTHGDRSAVATTADAVSFRDLLGLVDHRAQQLAELGASKATRLGILLPNGVDWLACALGALTIGAQVVPLNTLWRRNELEHALRFADVSVLAMCSSFLKHDYSATLLEICPGLAAASPDRMLLQPELPALRHVVALGPTAPAWSLPLDGVPSPGNSRWLEAAQAAVQVDEPAMLFFTSGTTAAPKIAVHTQRSILTAAHNIAECLGLDAQDCTWGYLPFFFTGGFVAVALATLSRGGTVLLQEAFDAGAAIDLIERYGGTTFFAWPHQAQAIADHPRFDRAKLRLRKGPGAQTPWARRIFVDDHQAVSTWGMTESGPMAACARFDDPLAVRTGAHGRAMPGTTLRIIDPDTQRVLAPGEQGELLIHGPTLMAHYYKAPRNPCFDREGFFHTGDLAWLAADGLLHFVGRLKDVIKTAGANVPAAEVEAVLQQHPAVKAAYVVGIPDATRGENIGAVVVATDSSCTPSDLVEHCRRQLASYKVPRVLRLLAEEQIPLLGSGKVDKRRLLEHLC